jgi:serine/threonine protein kinase/Leucine-rich repeat (LRR) protein
MSNAAAVEALFFAALEREAPAERAAYLESACSGDSELRRQVEKMLKAHPRVGDFLKRPAVEHLAATPGPSDATQEFDTAPDHRGPDLARTEGGEAGDDEDTALDFLQPSTRPDSLGRLGHYEILQILGKGGFGIVFRAFDETLQRVVAVKVLAPALAANSPARKRFLREARSSARARHENVVQVYAVEEQPLPYLVMELIPGETLQQRLERTGPMEVTEAVRIGRQIAEGLAAAHRTGLVHRDIKPGNILLEAGPHPCVKITDFGLARAADDASLTQSGVLTGTPMFMAPEQANGEAVDQRADLFSFGSVLYTMCSGRPPFRANSTLAVLKRVAEDTPRPIPEIIPEVPQWLCDIIARLQAKRPEDRFASAQEVADLLGRHLAQLQHPGHVQAPPRSVAPPAVEKLPTQETPKAALALRRPPFRIGRWAAAVFLMLLGSLSITEATGLTNVRGTVIRLFSPEGTLVVEVDDPGVSVQIDGSDLVITGAGAKEIRLRPGRYTVEARKDGRVVSRELVTVTKDGKQVVRVSQEATVAKDADAGGKEPGPKTAPPGKKPPVVVRSPVPSVHDTWIKALAALPIDQQEAALVAKMNARLPGFEDAFLNQMAAMPADRQVFLLTIWLKERNPGFDGKFTHKIEDGMVTSLELPAPIVQDLTPLRALLNLRALTCRSTVGWDNNAENDVAVLRSLEALETINDKPVAVFWKEVKARQADFQEFLKVVPALTAEQQVSAVAARLKEHNPGFGGQVQSKIEGGVVTEIGLGGPVTDLSPLRALVGLKVLNYSEGPLSDLAPLKGMKLAALNLDRTLALDLSPLKGMPLTSLSHRGVHFDPGHRNIQDLTPLRGLPLTSLNLSGSYAGGDLGPLKGMKLTALDLTDCSGVRDLSPLKDMPLTTLSVGGWYSGNQVQDLGPLRGMKLTALDVSNNPIRDLGPLRGMKLTRLDLHWCSQLKDLEPLTGMPLTWLNVDNTTVEDVAPLKGMPLTYLVVARTGVRDLAPLKGMPLKTLWIFESNGITDLTPLQGMSLEFITLTSKNITQGMDILRKMKSLRNISENWTDGIPAADYWAAYDKREPRK